MLASNLLTRFFCPRYYVDFTLGDHLLYPTEKSQHQLIMSTGKATLSIKQEPVSADESIEEYSFLEKISMLDSEDKSETEDDLLEILSSNDQSFAKRWNDFLGNDDAEQKTANNTADINDFKRESSEPEVRQTIIIHTQENNFHNY